MLNGEPGRPIKHSRGLHQGGQLSPMLFILAMDPIQKLLKKPTQEGLISPIGTKLVKMCTSLHADDAVLFMRPIVSDVRNLKYLLEQCENATCLCTNAQKSQVFLIRCEAINIPKVLGHFKNASMLPCVFWRIDDHQLNI
jgi:hypothetical protein